MGFSGSIGGWGLWMRRRSIGVLRLVFLIFSPRRGGEAFSEAVGFVFEVVFGAVAGLGEVGVLVALEDCLEDGDLEGGDLEGGVVVDEGV